MAGPLLLMESIRNGSDEHLYYAFQNKASCAQKRTLHLQARHSISGRSLTFFLCRLEGPITPSICCFGFPLRLVPLTSTKSSILFFSYFFTRQAYLIKPILVSTRGLQRGSRRYPTTTVAPSHTETVSQCRPMPMQFSQDGHVCGFDEAICESRISQQYFQATRTGTPEESHRTSSTEKRQREHGSALIAWSPSKHAENNHGNWRHRSVLHGVISCRRLVWSLDVQDFTTQTKPRSNQNPFQAQLKGKSGHPPPR